MKTTLALLALLAPLAAQTAPQTVRFHETFYEPIFGCDRVFICWPSNPQPDTTVECTITFPADASGNVIPPGPDYPEGYPVLVLMQGFASSHSPYYSLVDYFAERFYVVVQTSDLNIGAQSTMQQADAAGMYEVMQADTISVNGGGVSVLNGRIDPTRIALGGHSMGGGSAFVVDGNPKWNETAEYDAIVAWAPWGGAGGGFITTDKGNLSEAPALIIVGAGDGSFVSEAHTWFEQTKDFTSAKVLIELEFDTRPAFGAPSVGHFEPVYRNDPVLAPWKYLVFMRSMEAADGWLKTQLYGDPSNLDKVCGQATVGLVGENNWKVIRSNWRLPVSYLEGSFPNQRLVTFSNTHTSTVLRRGVVSCFFALTLGLAEPRDTLLGVAQLTGSDSAVSALPLPYTYDHWSYWSRQTLNSTHWRGFIKSPVLTLPPFGGYLQLTAGATGTTHATVDSRTLGWSNVLRY